MVQASAPLAAAEIIVDNLSPGFTKTGTWSESAAVDEYAANSVTATAIGAKATWRPTVAQAGNYEVWAWWSAKKSDGTSYDRDSAADYTVHYNGGTSVKTVNQDLASGQWNLLGTYSFAAGTGGYVDLVRDTANGTSTCADAVKLVQVTAPTSDVIVDNAGAGFTKTGTWSESAAVDEYAGSSVTASAIGAKATWRPTLSQAGNYQVYAWWSGKKADGTYYDRDSLADYVVHYNGGTSTKTVNQDVSCGQWNLLGTFAFTAGTAGYVDLTRDTANGASTCADAVKFVYQGGVPTTTTWYVDDVTDPLESGTALHPFDHIQEAINAAQSGDEVIVNTGTYREAIVFRGRDIKIHSTDPTNAKTVAATVIGDRTYFTQQYGEDNLPDVVTFSGTETVACTLSGFTITGGLNGIEGNGGRANIQNNHITGNGLVYLGTGDDDAGWSGGGIDNCDGIIGGNDVFNNFGRGLARCDGTVRQNTIRGNVDATVSFKTSLFPGGGLYDCNGVIEENVISGNSGGYRGGGLANCNGIIRRNIIIGNVAEDVDIGSTQGYGGGLADCDAIIESNVIYGNSGGWGGGLFNCNGQVRNCTFANNTAVGGNSDDPVGNAADYCAGVFTNCLIADATVFTPDATFKYCNVNLGGASTGIDGGGNINVTPLFANAADPDGADNKFFTADDGLSLLSGSRCIDAGNGSVAPAIDILGNARRDDAGTSNTGTGTPDYTDIGAYEFQGASPASEIIVDNLGAGFTKTGTWNESAAVDEYAGSSVTASAIGAKATWRPTLPTAGSYEVWAWWSAKKSDGTTYDRDSTASYIVHYSGGSASRTVNQDVSSGQWVRLGTFTFAAGTGGYVDLTRDAADGASTCADAVKFVKVV